MAVQLLPNCEAIVSAFLRAQAEMIALVNDRTYTELPGNVVFPAVRVNQYDDVKVTQRPLWVAKFSLQIEAWGGSKADAFNAASTAQSCMAERLAAVHSGGVVTNVDFGALRDLPDRDFTPAKPRWLFSAYVTCHPL